ncbi:MAG TPA: hydantoinase/oxoprolinase family protein [Solirubrobacterales bacterium]|nr:hydantoinase/oxoprolinase family protein [Solirubrobacterales bacterium]
MKSIGIDVGGTFTDFVLFDSDGGEVAVLKLSSGGDTSATMVEGIEELCQQAGVAPADLGLIIHGTTVATNAVLEYDGAKAGMITTDGFRDVIHIGRHQRPQNYSIQQDIPWQARPLVKRRFRKPVPERLAPPSGEVLTPLDEDAVRAAAAELAAEGVEAVSVCFLFSYLNDEHERRAAEIVREEMPDAFVCTSSEIVPQFREFERFATTAVNAFVGPRVEHYIERLDARVKESGVTAPLHIMQSNGGTATPEVAARKPVTLLLSGPVGGVMGGIWSAEGKQRHLATLDVGGTSADIGIVTEEGLVEARARDTWIAGYPVLVPIIDIETIGAGGGSIAYLDRAGALHVGPRSAGAHPGPAAYGRGGTEPTVTDANVVLGRLPSSLAGRLELDRERAEAAVAGLGEKLGMSALETATGIIRIVNENMAAALRMKTIQRGLDPREFLLSAFGGAGPLQAAELARILEIPEVLIPPNPGVTSAAGLLTSDLRYDVSQSFLQPLSRIDLEQLRTAFREQEEELRAQLRNDGCGEEDIVIEWAADLRYHGQSYELKTSLPAGELSEQGIASLREAFHRDHQQEFGHSFPEFEIELVNARLTGIGRLPHLRHSAVTGTSLAEAHLRDAEVGFAVDGGNERLRTPVYDRDAFPVGEELAGPAIFVQLDSTTLVPPGATARRDDVGNLLIAVSAPTTDRKE